MESQERRPPEPLSPTEARTALRDAEQARRSLDTVTVPWWFTCALAGYMAAVALVQMLPGVWGVAFSLALVALIIPLSRVTADRMGFSRRLRGADPALLAMVGAAVLAAMVAGISLGQEPGREWVWYPVAAINTALILALDLFYRLRARRAAA